MTQSKISWQASYSSIIKKFEALAVMDLHLEKFLNEVSHTLKQGPESITTARMRLSVHRSMTDNGQCQDLDLDRDASTESDENSIYSAAKRRRLNYRRQDISPSASSDDEFAPQAAEDTDVDDVPDFFHPSKLWLIYQFNTHRDWYP